MVEGSKAPKAYDMQAAPVLAPSPNTSASYAPQPTSYAPQPSYAPTSILPGYTPGGRPPGSLMPSFTPTAPYRNLFDPTPSH